MELAPAAYRDLLKMVPMANRETHRTLRAHVRELSLTQRTCDDLGLQVAHDTSAPMDIGKARLRKARRANAKGKTRTRKIMVKRKDVPR